MHYAVIADDLAIVSLLLSRGADPTIEDSRGLTPIDYCTNEEVTALLRDHSAQASLSSFHAMQTLNDDHFTMNPS